MTTPNPKQRAQHQTGCGAGVASALTSFLCCSFAVSMAGSDGQGQEAIENASSQL